MNRDDLQRHVLRALASGQDTHLAWGSSHLAAKIKETANVGFVHQFEVMEAVWALVAQGLVYIDYTQPAPSNWALRLTSAGRAAVRDAEYNPDDPSGYLRRLFTEVPMASPAVKRYATEAVHSYNVQCYLASAVMQGVASECAFLELGTAFMKHLQGAEHDRFETVFANPKQTYLAKFGEFRKRLEPQRPNLPPEFRDGLDVWLNAVLDLLRIYRNDAGHPSGKSVDKDECFLNLRVLAIYLRKMYALKEFLEGQRGSD